VDLANKVVFIDDSKTPTGVAEAPLTDISVEAFSSQVELAGPGPWLFPSDGNRTGHQTEFKKAWGTGPALKSLPFRPLSKKRQLDQKCRTNAAFGFETECAPRASARSRTEQSQAPGPYPFPPAPTTGAPCPSAPRALAYWAFDNFFTKL
jgi:hypothetical protein